MAMSAAEQRAQARAWARVARAIAACQTTTGPDVIAADVRAANRELFDAIAFAVTEARLPLPDVVDAYSAGAPQLDLHEACDDIEAYLTRIATVQASAISAAFERTERALPDWRRQLALRIAAHDLALAAQRALGGHDDRIDTARQAVADILDRARAANASERELDAFIATLRIEHCDVASVIAAAAWLAHERGRLAQQRAVTLPSVPWATTEEIAHDRGIPIAIAQALVDDALQRGLLRELPGRGVIATHAGQQHARDASAP
jgi:hypothetical protein